MAEAIAVLGVIASVAQLADYGFKLSIKLFAFGEAVSKADKNIKSLSNEVSLTSAVLKELGEIFKADEANYVSERAVEATEQTVKECFVVFEQLDKTLQKTLGNRDFSDKREALAKISTMDKLKWPFFQPKMDLLRTNLDRLKASLTLMLQVLSYARDISSRKEAQESLGYQKQLIESLARAEREARQKYEALQRLIEGSNSQQIDRGGSTVSGINPGERPPPYTTDDVSITTVTIEATFNSTETTPSKPVVGELILCFNLVQNLLNQQLSNASNSLQYKSYLELRKAVETAQEAELKHLEEHYGERAFQIALSAARNAIQLQARLRELAAAQQSIAPAPRMASKRNRSAVKPKPLEEAKKKQELQNLLEERQETTISQEAQDEHGESIQSDANEDESLDGVARVNSHGSLALALSDTATPPSVPYSVSAPLPQFVPPSRPVSQRVHSSSSVLLAKIEETLVVEQDSANQVSQGHESLDSLSGRTETLSVSAQGFRRGSHKSPKAALTQAWESVTDTVSTYGSASVKGIQNLSGSIYEAGVNFFSDLEEEDGTKTRVSTSAAPSARLTTYQNVADFLEPGRTERDSGEVEADEENYNENLVRDLLSEWTTLREDIFTATGSPAGETIPKLQVPDAPPLVAPQAMMGQNLLQELRDEELAAASRDDSFDDFAQSSREFSID